MLTIISCNDNVGMNKSDLQKYPWLSPFLISEINGFDGSHQIDIGTLTFSFSLPAVQESNLFNTFDSIAQVESWSLVDSSKLARTYAKKLNQFDADTATTLLIIEMDTIEKRIGFCID